MSINTPNLNLYKKDPIADKNDTFSIKTMMNDNWDKIDIEVGNIKQKQQESDRLMTETMNRQFSRFRKGSMSIPNNIWTKVILDSLLTANLNGEEDFILENGSIKILTPGVYLFIIRNNFTYHSTGMRGMRLLLNGNPTVFTKYVNPFNGDSKNTLLSESIITGAGTNSLFSVEVFQNSGAALNLAEVESTFASSFEVYKLSDFK